MNFQINYSLVCEIRKDTKILFLLETQRPYGLSILRIIIHVIQKTTSFSVTLHNIQTYDIFGKLSMYQYLPFDKECLDLLWCLALIIELELLYKIQIKEILVRFFFRKYGCKTVYICWKSFHAFMTLLNDDPCQEIAFCIDLGDLVYV